MTVSRTTYHNFTWDYEAPLPLLDVQRHFTTQSAGRFSRLVGVDGRYSGSLKRFPGWLQLHDIGTTDPDGDGTITVGGSSVTLTEPFAIQQGITGTSVVRGVLFMGIAASKDKLYAYASINGGAMTLFTVVDFGTGTGRPSVLDVTADNQLLYICGQDTQTTPAAIEKLARYTGSTNGWKSIDWDSTLPKPIAFDSISQTHPFNILLTDTKRPGWMEAGDLYALSYRYVYPDQGFVGPLSRPQVITASPDVLREGSSVYLSLKSNLGPDSNYGNIFSRALVQVFRTISPGSPEVQARGGLFLEAEHEVPRLTGSKSTTFKYTDYNQGAKTIGVVDGSPFTEGDFLYVQWAVESSGANAAANADLAFVTGFLRRKVTGVSGNTLTLDKDLGGKNTTVYLTDLRVTGSVEGDGDDTGGSFVTMAVNRTTRPILVGTKLDEKFSTPDMPQGLSDEALAFQPRLDAAEFSTFSNSGNPSCKFIESYEGMFIRVTNSDKSAGIDLGGGALDVLRWGFVDRPRKGLIPVLNRRIVADLTDSVSGILRADPFLIVVLNNNLLRIHRSGSRLAVDTIHNRFGTAHFKSVVAVGTNLYFASPTGILLADLTSGSVEVLNATQHFFDEGGSGTGNWRDDLASIFGAYDAQAGALVFLNAAKFEMLIVWLNHGVFTHCIDVPFDEVFTSGDLQTGGLRQAVFWNQVNNSFHRINYDRSADSFTTFSFATDDSETATYRGTSTSVTSDKLVDTAATFVSQMVGHFVRVRQTAGHWTRARITARDSATQLSLDTDIVGSTGLRYEVGSLPMQGTFWPLAHNPQEPLRNLYRMKKVYAMGCSIAAPSRTLTVTDEILYQLFERTHTPATPTAVSDHVASVEQALDSDENAKNFAKIVYNSTSLVPGFELWASNLDLDLLGLVAQGSIERSLRDVKG